MAFWKLRCLQQQNSERQNHNYLSGDNLERVPAMKISPSFRKCTDVNSSGKENGQPMMANEGKTVGELYARPFKHTDKTTNSNGTDALKKRYTPQLARKTPSIGPIVIKTLSYENRQIAPTADNMVDAPSLALLQSDQQESYLSNRISSMDKTAELMKHTRVASSKMNVRGATSSSRKAKQFQVMVQQQRKVVPTSSFQEGRSSRQKSMMTNGKHGSIFTTTISIPFGKSPDAEESRSAPSVIVAKIGETESPSCQPTAKEMYPCFLMKSLTPEATPYVPVQVFPMMLVKNN